VSKRFAAFHALSPGSFDALISLITVSKRAEYRFVAQARKARFVAFFSNKGSMKSFVSQFSVTSIAPARNTDLVGKPNASEKVFGSVFSTNHLPS
jgi:hypothetical protein